MRKLLLFFLTMGVPSVVLGAELLTPTVTQLENSVVVVAWETEKPGSSQVRYSSDRFIAEQTTPEYASDTKQHQVKVTGLIPNETYTFQGTSTLDTGEKVVTSPIPYTLKNVGSARSATSGGPAILVEDNTSFNPFAPIGNFFSLVGD